VKLNHEPKQRLIHAWLTFGRWGWLCFELIHWGRPWRWKVGVMTWVWPWRRNLFWLPGRAER